MRFHLSFLFTLPLLIASTHSNAQETLKMVTEAFPPYEYIENGELKGIDVEILNLVTAELGIDVDVTFLPWARALKEVKAGNFDAMFTMGKTKEREDYLYFTSTPISYEQAILITHKSSKLQANALSDLSGWRIAQIRDTIYGPPYDDYQEVQRVPVRSYEQLLALLNTGGGRIDAAVMNKAVLSHHLREKGISEKYRVLDYEISTTPLYIAFPKIKGDKSKKMSERFSRTLEKLDANGDIQRIQAKYSAVTPD